MENFTRREEIIETVNKLFVYADHQRWDDLMDEVFAEKVHLNMSSMGGPNEYLTAKAICDMWEAGFEGIDQINHLAGNHLVRIDGNSAEVFCYATATHFKAAATQGTTREFVGSYDMKLSMTEAGWRIHALTYNMKYIQGNKELT